MEQETFWTLIRDLPHWEFEIFLILIFDGVIGVLIWPNIKKMFRHHTEDDDKITELEERIKTLEQEKK
jgi:hypothetical protein